MATLKEIKSRIESVKQTQKITNAMYLISSTKLRKARAEMDATRPYYNMLHKEVKRIFSEVGDVDSKYLTDANYMQNDTGTWACLLITSDKGLAGNFNRNVIKEATALQEKHEDMLYYVIGESGKRYMANHEEYKVAEDFEYSPQNPTIGRARLATVRLQDDFENGVFDRLYIVFTDMKNSLVSETVVDRIIPFSKGYFYDPLDKEEEKDKELEEPVDANVNFEYVPSAAAVMDRIIPLVIVGYIYSALVNSFCSEQNARMMAMDSANTNAEEILAEYTLQYNRVRQGAITQEITEIAAGANAQKSK